MPGAEWLVYLVVIAAISLMVIVHESGHYFMARAFGMRVLRFSIGIGPAIFKYQRKGSPTIFQVCVVPFRLRAGRRDEPDRGDRQERSRPVRQQERVRAHRDHRRRLAREL